ncbi:MAG TPA: HAD-IA family hydrolase [Jatrophihabitans sp.]|nr:HAD-IA family hydrolase [Jatrophihabitans sp.]
MPTALIIDLDGVLRHWDPAIIQAAEHDNGLPAGALTAAAFGDAGRLKAATTGRITDDQWRAAIADELAAQHGEGGRKAVVDWSEPCGEIDAEVLDLVRDQRAVRTVALLSNATDRLTDDLRRLGVHDEFDAIFNSWQLGVAKPDPLTFRRVHESLGRQAEDCLFVDDAAANVEAAIALGLTGHHYRGAAGLREFLAAQS